MSKSVKINGVTYNNVPSVSIPLSDNSGNASFVDTDSGDAIAGDIRSGKKTWVEGMEVTGSVAERTSTDLTVSGKTVTVPGGIYDTQTQKSVADGSATPTASVSGDEIGDTPSSYDITVTPGATVSTPGYISSIGNGSAITKYIQTEEKNATPTGSAQDITPSTGKLLSKVTVSAVSLTGNAAEGDVIAGKTFYSNSLTKKTGTLNTPAISQNGTTFVLMVS